MALLKIMEPDGDAFPTAVILKNSISAVVRLFDGVEIGVSTMRPLIVLGMGSPGHVREMHQSLTEWFASEESYDLVITARMGREAKP